MGSPGLEGRDVFSITPAHNDRASAVFPPLPEETECYANLAEGVFKGQSFLLHFHILAGGGGRFLSF